MKQSEVLVRETRLCTGELEVVLNVCKVGVDGENVLIRGVERFCPKGAEIWSGKEKCGEISHIL